MRRKRITIARKSRKIGFLGKGMAVPSRERSEIAQALDLRIEEDLISTAESDLETRRYDANPVPAVLGRLFSRTPRIVVFPNSATCLADVIDTCIEEKTPVLPRGAGTSGLGGAACVRGGVVLDLSRMSQVVSIDKSNGTATVEAGCTWTALEDELAKEGLCLRCYPSSAPFSTVGGWMSTGGYGIGTLREGCFHRQVKAMEVALPSGLLVTSGPGDGRYDIATFAGTEGQMGVIAKLTVSVRDLPESEATYLVRLDDLSAATDILQKLGGMDEPPLSVTLVSSVKKELLIDKESPGTHGGPFILVRQEGNAGSIRRAAEIIRKWGDAAGASIDEGCSAIEAWQQRFTRLMPGDARSAYMAGEVLVEVAGLAELLKRITRDTRGTRGIAYECQLVDRDLVLVRVGYVKGEAGPNQLLRDIVLTNLVVEACLGVDARPYGIGIWNTCYAGKVLGPEYKRLRQLKGEIDRLGILNPGKFFSLKTNLGFPVFGWLYHAIVGVAGKR